MQINREAKFGEKILALFVAILLGSIIFSIISQNSSSSTLDVYSESDRVAQSETTQEETELDIDYEIYTSTDPTFSINIPSDWTQVTKSGYQTFIHSASASSLQIQVYEYDPSINNMTEEEAAYEVVEEGCTYVSYTRTSVSTYELMYQDYDTSTYDYIEEVYWDRDYIIKLVCVCNDENYSAIVDYFEFMINSFSWSQSNEIPDGYSVCYADSLLSELLIPSDWTASESSGALYAVDSTSGTTVTLSYLESTLAAGDITTTEMASLLNTNKSTYLISSHTKRDTVAIVNSTYLSGDVQYTEVVYAYSTGQYIFFVIIDYQDGMIEEEIVETIAESFRFFGETASDESADATDE